MIQQQVPSGSTSGHNITLSKKANNIGRRHNSILKGEHQDKEVLNIKMNYSAQQQMPAKPAKNLINNYRGEQGEQSSMGSGSSLRERGFVDGGTGGLKPNKQAR